MQGEETHLNTLRGKYKTLAPDLNNEERIQAEGMINKIQVKCCVIKRSGNASFVLLD